MAKTSNQGREPVVNGSGEEAGMFDGHRRQTVPAPVKMPYRTIGDEQQVAGTAGIDLRSGHLDQARSIWMKRPVRSRTPGVVGAAGGKPAVTRLWVLNSLTISYIDIYDIVMITNFKSKLAQDIYDGSSTSKSRKFPKQLVGKTTRLLDQLNIVKQIDELLIPPSNHLEKLKGDLSGFWSLRINKQWRIIFQWDGKNVSNVDILDYH